MQLKNHLNFLGDRNKQEITFHLSGAFNKNVVVGVDDFDKVWSYLVLLSKQHTEADILQWKENYHVTDAELCGIHSFLVTQGMVYLSDSSVKNIRLANFMGNWVSSTTYGDLNSIMSSKHVVILGAGTVGSSLIDYEEYPGSVTDVSQFTFMVDKVLEYGYKQIGFILDRGYFSKENIRYIDENGYSFIIMCKGCKTLVSSLVLENRGTFEAKREAAIRAYKVYGITTTARLYEDDTAERYFHIYYNPSKQAAERERLEQRIEKLRQFMDRHVGKDEKFGKTYQEYFHLHYSKQGIFLGADERTDVIERELQLCGYFCIITSEKMTASQALIQYKGRDISEKLFQSDKTFIGSKSERVQSSQSMSSKIFIEFVALIVRNRIYNLLKEQMIRMETKQKYMTVPAAIRELEKIEMVRRNGRNYKLDHAVTRTQKLILNSFGLDETDIQKRAEEYGKLLNISQSYISKEAQDNGEEEDD